jgi:hypothetical protein
VLVIKSSNPRLRCEAGGVLVLYQFTINKVRYFVKNEYDLIKFSLIINNTCHRKNSARQSEKRFLVLLFNIIFVVDPYGIWTSLKMVLTLLNFNRYRLLKFNGVNH